MDSYGMDDIEILKLENKALRIQHQTLTSINKKLEDEVKILRRYRQLIERSTQIAAAVEDVPAQVLPAITVRLDG